MCRFYDGTLKDWEGVEAAAKPPLPYYSIPIFKPVVFFSLDSKDSVENTSRVNRDEIDFICQMLELLKCLVSSKDTKHKAKDPHNILLPSIMRSFMPMSEHVCLANRSWKPHSIDALPPLSRVCVSL